MLPAMSRIATLAALGLLASCSKSTPTSQEVPSAKPAGRTPPARIAVPGADSPPPAAPATAGGGEAFRLKAEEGKVEVPPASGAANAEIVAKVVLVPTSEFKVNTEFKTKLTLENSAGVTIAKSELNAGGMDKLKGDAEVFGEHELVFNVKLTPTATGTHTIKGTFNFAVCDRTGTTCLPKREPIAIQIAAK
jgi:hypothetical protein